MAKPGRRGPTAFLDDADLEDVRLRAALGGRPIALFDRAKAGRALRATTPVMMQHGRIATVGALRAVGMDPREFEVLAV